MARPCATLGPSDERDPPGRGRPRLPTIPPPVAPPGGRSPRGGCRPASSASPHGCPRGREVSRAFPFLDACELLDRREIWSVPPGAVEDRLRDLADVEVAARIDADAVGRGEAVGREHVGVAPA